jgi:hypothetical protein
MSIRKLAAVLGAFAIAAAVVVASNSAFAQLIIGGQSSNFGRGQLNGGFMPDPFMVQIVSGGNMQAASVGNGCRGWVTNQPDYILNYFSPASFLRFYFVGGGDTTLVVNDAAGQWRCNDDSWGSLNPTVDIAGPPQGQYDIWIGSYRSGENVRGTLHVTELRSRHP